MMKGDGRGADPVTTNSSEHQRDPLRCSVESLVNEVAVCWVPVGDSDQVKVAFPAAILREKGIGEGCHFSWVMPKVPATDAATWDASFEAIERIEPEVSEEELMAEFDRLSAEFNEKWAGRDPLDSLNLDE